MSKLIYFAKITFLFLSILGISNKAQANRLIYFSDGKQEELPEYKIGYVLQIIDKLVVSADDALRMIVTGGYVNELRSGKGIEIILDNEHWVRFADPKLNRSFTRFIVPFCNEQSCTNKPAEFLSGKSQV